jgi:ADP-heptose:LPS heptosyltransferase
LAANPQIQFFGDALNHFSDTADLIQCVDLVISTCTSVPHLSCSLGKETWLILSYMPDWRWLLGRNDSPWYSTVKLYRQNIPDDWGSVFTNVREDLLSMT